MPRPCRTDIATPRITAEPTIHKIEFVGPAESPSAFAHRHVCARGSCLANKEKRGFKIDFRPEPGTVHGSLAVDSVPAHPAVWFASGTAGGSSRYPDASEMFVLQDAHGEAARWLESGRGGSIAGTCHIGIVSMCRFARGRDGRPMGEDQ